MNTVWVFSSIVGILVLFSLNAEAEESARLPSSWNRCTCSVNPVIKTATEECSSEASNNAKLTECILRNAGVLDGSSVNLSAAEQLVDGFTATDAQKASLKKSLQSCEPQSHHDPGRLNTCIANVLRRRCLTDPKTVCNSRE